MIDLKKISTEAINQDTLNIDHISTEELVRLINNEDKKVPLAVEKVLPAIASMIDITSNAILNGGRLIYMGAGTSGRLGVLDASECPPTYGVSDELVVGLIAGGDYALRHAVENAEDSPELAQQDLKNINLTAKDVVIGIAASGRTPYAIGGLQYASSVGAKTGAVACSADAEMARYADVAILPVVGAEAVTGSTRMKSGTAQKLVLNMISTGTMIKIGKVYGNLMVDVKASNKKLIERQKRIVMEATGSSYEEASQKLTEAHSNCKLAIFMIISGLDFGQAEALLTKHKGFIRAALSEIKA